VGADPKPNTAPPPSTYLSPELCKEVVRDLKGIDEVELGWLVAELPYLPEMDPALQTGLGTLTPDMDRAIYGLQNGGERSKG